MNLTLTLPVGESIYTGRQVTFEAPCDSEGLSGLIVDGVVYALVDAFGDIPVANSFKKDALVSVIFHIDKKKAFIQNANTNAYLENKITPLVNWVPVYPNALSIDKGGTGARSAEKALANLGAAPANHRHNGTYLPMYTFSTEDDLVDGGSPLVYGHIHFVYEVN